MAERIEQPREPQFEEVEFEVNGEKEKVKAELVDLNSKEYDEQFEKAEWYKKSVEIEARQATQEEEVITALDATKNIAKPGDWIVTGTKGERYIIRKEKFDKLYKPKEGESGKFVSTGVPVKAIRTDKTIVFQASWGKQAVKAGGYLIERDDKRHGVEKEVFETTYKKIEPEKDEGKPTS